MIVLHIILSTSYYPHHTIHIILSTSHYPHHNVHIIRSTSYNPHHTIHIIQSTSYNPHHTGESLKKAVTEGRFDLANYRPPKGMTRGQPKLVPLQPPNDIDLRSVFVCVCAADYCNTLKVPVTLDPWPATLTLILTHCSCTTGHSLARQYSCFSHSQKSWPECWVTWGQKWKRYPTENSSSPSWTSSTSGYVRTLPPKNRNYNFSALWVAAFRLTWSNIPPTAWSSSWLKCRRAARLLHPKKGVTTPTVTRRPKTRVTFEIVRSRILRSRWQRCTLTSGTIHIILSTSYYPHHTIHIILSTSYYPQVWQRPSRKYVEKMFRSHECRGSVDGPRRQEVPYLFCLVPTKKRQFVSVLPGPRWWIPRCRGNPWEFRHPVDPGGVWRVVGRWWDFFWSWIRLVTTFIFFISFLLDIFFISFDFLYWIFSLGTIISFDFLYWI